MINVKMTVRHAVQEDRGSLGNMLYFGQRVHRHLDWFGPLEWLGAPEFWVLEQNQDVMASLALPPDPPGVYWLRLFVATGETPLEPAWQILWDTAHAFISRQGGLAAAIVLNPAFPPLLSTSGFDLREMVVMLQNTLSNAQPGAELPAGYTLRAMIPDDLPAVAELDARSFDPLWRNSVRSLMAATPIARFADTIEHNGQVVGYQLSTDTHFGVHLARLAVHPDHQGRGLGRSLVHHLIRQAQAAGKQNITVNTQKTNQASLALYRRTGFQLTGEEYPVYAIDC